MIASASISRSAPITLPSIFIRCCARSRPKTKNPSTSGCWRPEFVRRRHRWAWFALDGAHGEVVLNRTLKMANTDYRDFADLLEAFVNHLEAWTDKLAGGELNESTESESRASSGLLTDHRKARIMKTETREPEDVSQDILRKGQELVAQIQAMLDETDRLYRQHGLDRGSARRFLESGSLSPAQKPRPNRNSNSFSRKSNATSNAI
ncbi:MAG: type III secretion system chaperone [Candidatus Competibacteraceae bacterium]|nr:type III secretion system chaperone [Candidatus Competibacteraceae bacterium]